jgi:tryptophan 2,3-dioxygenase
MQPAYKVLETILDIDELMSNWRHRHALMVHRMLGVKIGTGGSSGYHYLRLAAQMHRVFVDLFNMSTFLLPEDALPPLPGHVADMLRFPTQQAIADVASLGSGVTSAIAKL